MELGQIPDINIIWKITSQNIRLSVSKIKLYDRKKKIKYFEKPTYHHNLAFSEHFYLILYKVTLWKFKNNDFFNQKPVNLSKYF